MGRSQAGRHVLLLEISRPRSAALLTATRFYIRTVVGTAFARATGNQNMRTLMRYWWDTTEHCVAPEAILSALGQAGLGECELRELFNGLIRDYRAINPGGRLDHVRNVEAFEKLVAPRIDFYLRETAFFLRHLGEVAV